MTKLIECTKDKFLAALLAEFPEPNTEMYYVMKGLAKQANEHRGVFRGHSAYFDIDFEVRPIGDSTRKPGEAIHYQGTDGETLCGLRLSPELTPLSRSVNYFDDPESNCPTCTTEALKRLENTDPPVDEFEGHTCCDSNDGQGHEDSCLTVNDGGVCLIGTPYEPSPAIVAMINHTGKRRSDGHLDNELTHTYQRFQMLVAGIRAERPDWSDVQARDWLRAQLDR